MPIPPIPAYAAYTISLLRRKPDMGHMATCVIWAETWFEEEPSKWQLIFEFVSSPVPPSWSGTGCSDCNGGGDWNVSTKSFLYATYVCAVCGGWGPFCWSYNSHVVTTPHVPQLSFQFIPDFHIFWADLKLAAFGQFGTGGSSSKLLA